MGLRIGVSARCRACLSGLGIGELLIGAAAAACIFALWFHLEGVFVCWEVLAELNEISGERGGEELEAGRELKEVREGCDTMILAPGIS